MNVFECWLMNCLRSASVEYTAFEGKTAVFDDTTEELSAEREDLSNEFEWL